MYNSYHWNCANLPEHPLPAQTSRLISYHHYGPAAEDLLVPEERVPQGCTGQSGYCDYYVGSLQFEHVSKQIPKLLLVDMVILGTLWWSPSFKLGKGQWKTLTFPHPSCSFSDAASPLNSVFQPFALTALCHTICFYVRCNYTSKRIP